MTSIKLVALDMDGTLLDKNDNISPTNRAAIARTLQKGIDVVLSTGRFIISASEYAKDLNLSSYIITTNGSEIRNPEGTLIEQHILDNHWVRKMHTWGAPSDRRCWGMTTETIYRDDHFPQDLSAHKWLKFGIEVPDTAERQAIWQELASSNALEVTNSTPKNVEINPKNVSKKSALETICTLENITMNEVLTMGDSLNDLAMIQAAGVGIAMGNAQENVKAAADWVTTDHNEDGVAHALDHWL